MQDVLNVGSGFWIQPRISTKTNFPVAAKTGTNDNNSSTWVVGYTSGLATATWFGDPLGSQNRAGQNVTINGKFYPGIDGYMIAGPQFANYMLQVAPSYGTNPFPAPPSNMINGAPAPRPTTQSTSPAQAPTQAPAPAPTGSDDKGRGNG